MTSGRSPVSVVIPCHSERRFDYLVSAIESARTQSPAPAEIVVVVDHNPALFERIRRELPSVSVLQNRFERGVSGTRDTGAFHTITPLIAFLDDDILAYPGWLAGLVEPFADLAVIGAGGGIEPRWETSQPDWLPDEFLWAVGGSYTGMPTRTAEVRDVWSASMAVRREVFVSVGGFRTDFGKVGDRSRPEDTELCLRMSRAGGGRWRYVPDAVISHPVQAERATFRYFLTRCFNEGRGKVLMARLLDGADARDAESPGAVEPGAGKLGAGQPGAGTLDSERHYLRSTLPRAVRGGLVGALRGRGARHGLRAGAVLAGVAAAALGALAELLAGRPPRPTDPATVVTPERRSSPSRSAG